MGKSTFVRTLQAYFELARLVNKVKERLPEDTLMMIEAITAWNLAESIALERSTLSTLI